MGLINGAVSVVQHVLPDDFCQGHTQWMPGGLDSTGQKDIRQAAGWSFTHIHSSPVQLSCTFIF